MKFIFGNVTFLFFISVLVLSGCGTIKSTSSNPGAVSIPGVSYYLPAQRAKAELYRNKSSDGNPKYMLQISSGVTYPDTSKKYTIDYKPSAFNDEHLCIGRTTEGLLSTVQFSSTNRTGDILIRVAETAAMVALAAGGVPAPTPSPMGAAVAPEKEELELLRNLIRFTETKPDSSQFDLIYTGIFDIQVEVEIKAVEEQITEILKNELEFRELKRVAQISEWEQSKRRDRNLSDPRPKKLKFNRDVLKISFSKIGSDSGSASANDKACETANDNKDGGVIYYRTLTTQPVKISLKHEYETGEVPLGNIIIPAIDQSTDQCINVERALLVRKVNRLDFTNGLLTGTSINTPSVALAAAELPLRIGSAVIEMPASFFTAIGRSFAAQTAVAGREIELINALERLRLTKDKPDTATNITVQAPSGNPPSIGVTLSSPDPYKPLGGSNLFLTCWDGKANDNR
ncbi:hypothetical protein [Nitrosomonas oligotropha]|uniref:hypothetical protein n=1 Tax=Nitrosomonas oligotropha TaxID=42354 RepID=UPI00136BB084|nr:hypothetical protein [Nitrosomonas oligotropha]MXS83812.1 hypothetical protein [Nitrosomonas oligotropha]